MGAFLSEPVTDKISTDEEHERLSYGVCSMQGWRFTQEDNHSCFPSLDEKTSLFGVYDGHGGAEVSRYVASLLPDYVRERECWKEGEIGKALSEAFLALDAHLGSRKGLKVLKKLAAEDDAALDRDKNKSSADDDGDSEDSEENVRNLFKEAKMPLKVLMAKYGQALAAARNASDTSEDEEKESPSASKSPQGSKPKEEVSADVGGGSCAGPAKASKSDEEEKEGGEGEEGGGGGEGAEEKPKENGLPDEDEKPTKNGSGERLKLRSRQNRIVYSDNEDDDDSSDEEYDENSSPLVEEGEGGEDEDESSGDEEEEDDDDDDDDEEDDELAGGLATSDEFALNMLQGPGLDSGCTAVVAVLEDGGTLYVANAGDSRCILSRKGLAVDMSVDHKPEDEEESKRIMDAGGEVTSEGRVNGGLNLSRALGDHAYKQGKCGARKQMISALPDVRRIQLRKDEDEFMVLACDGIWNSMTSQEVVDFVRKRLYKKGSADELPSEMKERRKLSEGVKLSNICGEMFEYCLAPNTSGDGTGCDNMTAILVTFKEQMWKEGEGGEEGVAEEKVAKEKVAKEKVAEEKVAKEKVAEEKVAKEKVAVAETEGGPMDVEEDEEKEHGIVLLTPPPSPPPCVAMEDEEEESSEEEEDEEKEDEEEEVEVKVKEEEKKVKDEVKKVKDEVKEEVKKGKEEAKKIKEEVKKVKDEVKEEVKKGKEEAKKIKEEVKEEVEKEVKKVKEEVDEVVKVKKEVKEDVKSSGLGKGCKRLASKDSPTKGKKQKVEEEAS